MSKPHHMNDYNINNIECYTKKYAVDIILPYLPKDKIIWAPFDRLESNFVTYLREKGYQVVNSHIDYGQDFFSYEPPKGDMIVSNPPFRHKTKFVERALSFGKPFALILPLGALGDNGIPNAYHRAGKEIQLLIPIQRMEFDRKDNDKNAISFKCAYFCYNIQANPFNAGKQIVFCDMKKDRR